MAQRNFSQKLQLYLAAEPPFVASIQGLVPSDLPLLTNIYGLVTIAIDPRSERPSEILNFVYESPDSPLHASVVVSLLMGDQNQRIISLRHSSTPEMQVFTHLWSTDPNNKPQSDLNDLQTDAQSGSSSSALSLTPEEGFNFWAVVAQSDYDLKLPTLTRLSDFHLMRNGASEFLQNLVTNEVGVVMAAWIKAEPMRSTLEEKY